jgi:hypothetical protein
MIKYYRWYVLKSTYFCFAVKTGKKILLIPNPVRIRDWTSKDKKYTERNFVADVETRKWLEIDREVFLREILEFFNE